MSSGQNRGYQDRRETKIPSREEIKKMIEDSDTEKLVQFASDIGKGLAKNEELATSQIRNFFGEVKQIESLIVSENKLLSDEQKTISNEYKRRLILLKPKLAYQAGRHRPVKKLEEALTPAIDSAVGSFTYFRNFVNFFEAIIAYHKSNNGKE